VVRPYLQWSDHIYSGQTIFFAAKLNQFYFFRKMRPGFTPERRRLQRKTEPVFQDDLGTAGKEVEETCAVFTPGVEMLSFGGVVTVTFTMVCQN
jgi:hypothetical protein